MTAIHVTLLPAERTRRHGQGNALESELKDLRKARWYLDRKIARLERLAGKGGGDG